jgi:hypothetical protein
MWTNDAGYLTSFSESDPMFFQHPAHTISDKTISKWNTAFSWGNHADRGYITDGNKLWDNKYGFITASSAELLTNKKGAISMWENDRRYLTAADERDPKIGTNTAGRLPKWNGTQMVSSVVYENNGNVGIGTTNPQSRLEINNGDLTLNAANTDAGDLIFTKSDGTQLGRIWTQTAGMSGLFLSSGDNAADIFINENGDVTMGLSQASNLLVNGNVGIGKANPTEKLEVNGTVVAKRIHTTNNNNWPDYVFANDYSLMPLPVLKTYLKTNKHLPGVNSESEVREKGLDLGENQAVLLQKIEELTLYIIQLNEEVEKLKKDKK